MLQKFGYGDASGKQYRNKNWDVQRVQSFKEILKVTFCDVGQSDGFRTTHRKILFGKKLRTIEEMIFRYFEKTILHLRPFLDRDKSLDNDGKLTEKVTLSKKYNSSFVDSAHSDASSDIDQELLCCG